MSSSMDHSSPHKTGRPSNPGQDAGAGHPTIALGAGRQTKHDIQDVLSSTFPVEIVSEIFARYTTQFTDLSTPTFSSPTLLSSVSKRWREIAWSTPELWNTFSLNLIDVDKETVDILRDWLSRSGQLSLYLKITHGWSQNEAFQQEALDLLGAHRYRWFFLELVERDTGISSSFYSDVAQSEMLETLTLDLKDVDSLSLNLNRVQNLRNLTLPAGRLVFDKVQNIPWTHLKSLTCTIHKVDMLRQIFTQATSLANLEFSSWIPFEGNYANPMDRNSPIICHEHLTSLRMDEAFSNADVEKVLSRMKLPSLEHLQGPWCPNTDVLSFIRNSSCPLKSISLFLSLGTEEGGQQLEDILAEIPTLETLHLIGLRSEGAIDSLIARLSETTITHKASGSMFLPNLRTIKLDAVRFSWACFLDLLSNYPLGSTTRLGAFRRRPLRSLQISGIDLGLMNADLWHSAQNIRNAIACSAIDVTVLVTSNFVGPGDQLHSEAIPFRDYLNSHIF